MGGRGVEGEDDSRGFGLVSFDFQLFFSFLFSEIPEASDH